MNTPRAAAGAAGPEWRSHDGRKGLWIAPALTLPKALKQYINPRLLIVDEWLLSPLDDAETKLVFELIHKRRKKSSTIFCSQFLDDGWYERIGSEDNPLADSIMDRIKYDAYKINIKAIDARHDKSMREVYGLKASESH